MSALLAAYVLKGTGAFLALWAYTVAAAGMGFALGLLWSRRRP